MPQDLNNMRKNNLKIVKIDKNKTLFNYEKKILINDLVLNIKKVVTSNREIKKKLINKKFIFYFFLLAYVLTHEQIKLWHGLLQGW